MAKIILAEILKKKKMTKYRFAKLLDADIKNIHRHFRPEYDPKFSTLQKWAKVLKIKVKELIKD